MHTRACLHLSIAYVLSSSPHLHHGISYSPRSEVCSSVHREGPGERLALPVHAKAQSGIPQACEQFQPCLSLSSSQSDFHWGSIHFFHREGAVVEAERSMKASHFSGRHTRPPRGSALVRGNNGIWLLALYKVCGGRVGGRGRRMGRENSGGFVVECKSGVRWA